MYKSAINKTTDPEQALSYLVERTLSSTAGLFDWQYLPETIPEKRLEYILQKYGKALLIAKDGLLYAVNGAGVGKPDINDEYTVYQYQTEEGKIATVKNPIVIYNDSRGQGLLPSIEKYGALLVDSEITLRMVNILNRSPQLISASDKDTKISGEMFMQKLEKGDYSIIAENQFFDGIKSQAGTQGNILQTIELNKFYTAKLNQALGIKSLDNFKRAQVIEKEIVNNPNGSEFLIYDMLKNRQEACDRINRQYGLYVKVERNDFDEYYHTANVSK